LVVAVAHTPLDHIEVVELLAHIDDRVPRLHSFLDFFEFNRLEKLKDERVRKTGLKNHLRIPDLDFLRKEVPKERNFLVN